MPVALATASATGLAACGGPVAITELNDGGQYTHQATTRVAFWQMGDPDADRERVGRQALEFCGRESSRSIEDIRLSNGGGLYDVRIYGFACPQMGEE